MAMEQYFGEVATQQHTDSSEEDMASVEKWKSASATADGCENKQSGGFDCNICLDIVHEPVVTLCGHLYCWPCIYKWIYIQNFAAEIPDQQQPECPVCKAEISQGTLVPLYGRGQTGKSLEGEGPHLGILVPRRPPGPTGGVHILANSGPSQLLYRRGYPQQFLPYHPHRGNYPATPMVSLGGTMMTDEIRPMVGMFGEMLYSRIFGNSETTLYAYPNSHHLAGSSSPRVRRHLMQTDKSLGRVCFFLFCCMVLCLLLF